MPKGFVQKPELSTPFPDFPEFWHCPKTGLIVPKRDAANRQYRENILREAEDNLVMQKDLLAACKESFLYWLNTFAWTYHQEDICPITHRKKPSEIADHPFISWPVQDRVADELETIFTNGGDLLCKKSREMGASWEFLDFLHWLWLFREKTEIREMSHKEGLVDGVSDSLFWKHDYTNAWLPLWMRPPGVLIRGRENRTKLRIYNELNSSTIAGESTTAVSLSGGRCAILLLDEFSKCENGQQIRSATRDVAACRIINSTPFGAGTEYTRWKNSGQIKVIEMMYWDHPEKGAGRYIRKDDLGRFHIRSPWFDIEDAARSPQEVAQEILAEDIESGDTVFTITNIEKHMQANVREPKVKFNVILKRDIPNAKVMTFIQRRSIDAVDIRKARDGKLLWYGSLVFGRPDQSKQYIFGIDTSKGQGASESVISIKCKETGRKIGRWSGANSPPYEFARIVIAAALWCGGANPRRLPFLKWEENGPGWDLGRLIVKEFHYPYYYTPEKPGMIGSGIPKKQRKYGWHNSRQTKMELLDLYNRKLAHGGYVNPDKKSLEQCKLYIHYPGGGLGPAEMVFESASARLLHGDIVMADALTLEDDRIPQVRHKGLLAPKGSFAWRKDQVIKKKKKTKTWRKQFSFV
ncbi:hypothetical protein LCGC14_0422530 [marine sediment metagenome]|uniref:Terminase n=1 Tax=marine sediment metagenome TaxID=412755 RepID=A0A0F9SQA7_9ZZZZ